MKLTYIFISHDLALVKIMSDRIIVLKDGQMWMKMPLIIYLKIQKSTKNSLMQ